LKIEDAADGRLPPQGAAGLSFQTGSCAFQPGRLIGAA